MKSVFRTFFKSMFAVFGIFVALIVVFVIIGLTQLGSREVDTKGPYEMLPNAKGEKTRLSFSGPLILVIDIKGIIGTDDLDGDAVRKQIERAQEGTFRDRIKGVLLLINSPGGSVFDTDTIYRMLQLYKKTYDVPVYAYVDGLCASGGMYIACAADKVMATNISLIGSVGVLANFINVSEGLEKIGIKALQLTRGKGKGSMNPLVPWKDNEDENWQSILTYSYDQFVEIVTSNRPKMDKEKLINTYGAKVFPGPEALEYGYIDELVESQQEALTQLVQAAGVSEENYQVIRLETRGWIDTLLKGNWLFGELPPRGCLYLYENALPY